MNSRVNNYLFHVISIQQEATCDFKEENLKLLKLILQIFYLTMGFIESRQQQHHVPYKYNQNNVFAVV